MTKRFLTKARLSALMSAVLLVSSQASAADTPDAGKILREVEKAPGVQNAPTAPLVVPSPPPAGLPLPEKEGETIHVKNFHIIGSRFDEASLLKALEPMIDKDLTLENLQAVARYVGQIHRANDVLAHAYIPPQRVYDGIVVIAVVEGRLGKVKVEPHSELRLSPDIAIDVVKNRLQSDGEIRPTELDEAVAVLAEIPGVGNAISTLVPGENNQETDILLSLTDSPRISVTNITDNGGGPATGRVRNVSVMTFNDLTGYGDRFTATGLKSQGVNFLKLDFAAAVADSGLVMDVYGSALDYEVGWNFKELKLFGSAWTLGVGATYPVSRSEQFSLTLSSSVEHKRMVDMMSVSTVGDKLIDVGTIGMTSTLKDELWTGGVNSFDVGINFGHVNLYHNYSVLTSDASAAQTNGMYWKFLAKYNRQQRLYDDISLAIKSQFQYSPQNLDGSEKISFGGADSLRGYPSGQASGDIGGIAQFEPQWMPTAALTLYPFYEIAAVRQHQALWDSWQTVAGQPNSYVLQSAGFGTRWIPTNYLILSAVAAATIGPNLGHDSDYKNNDGSEGGFRAWFQAILMF